MVGLQTFGRARQRSACSPPPLSTQRGVPPRADIDALLKLAVQIMKQQHSAPVIDPCYALAGREEGAGEGPGDLVMY